MGQIGFPRSAPIDPATGQFAREWHVFFVALLDKVNGGEERVERLTEGTALTGTSAIVYTSPAKTTTTLKAVTVYNSTAGAVIVEINLVASGGAATVTNRVVRRSIAVDETYTCPELIDHALAAGGTVRALGNGLSITLSGIKET